LVEPAAQLALDAPDGYNFSTAATGGAVAALKSVAGKHGYLPYRAGLEASFVAWGPDVKRGVNLHRVRMTSEAPTILKALGVSDAKFGETPALEEIFK
jgi:predicted AlkP superfamily pyrophosphatase or phosphodiesterase